MGYAYIVLAAALWALLGPVARLALREGLTPFEIALWRCILGWILFVAHALITRRRAPADSAPAYAIRREDLGGIVAFGIVGIAGLYVAFPLAVQSGGAALAVVLLYTAPAWVAVFAWLLLKERLGTRKLIALALTLLGIGGIALSGGNSIRPSPAAFGWGLLSGISYASMYIFGKRYFARYAPVTVFVYSLPVAALVLLPLTTFHAPSVIAWEALLVIAVCSTEGAYLAYSAGLARLEVTQAAIVATAEPVLGALLAFVFWGERFAPLGYVAAALVLSGVLLIAGVRAPAASS
jgi:DME family drug/metabolite transporter